MERLSIHNQKNVIIMLVKCYSTHQINEGQRVWKRAKCHTVFELAAVIHACICRCNHNFTSIRELQCKRQFRLNINASHLQLCSLDTDFLCRTHIGYLFALFNLWFWPCEVDLLLWPHGLPKYSYLKKWSHNKNIMAQIDLVVRGK